MASPDPAETSALLQRLLNAGTVERFDILHTALQEAERRGAAQRPEHLRLMTFMTPGSPGDVPLS